MRLEKQLPYKYKVYNEIKQEILLSHYRPGDILNERVLSETLGISRTPVREALQMLVQDGWVQMQVYKGAVVRKFDPRYVQDLCRIRSALELCAIEDAVGNIEEEDIQTLASILEEQRNTMTEIREDRSEAEEHFDVSKFIHQDRQFHSYIYKLSRNQELVHLLENYYDVISFLGTQAATNTEDRRLSTVEEHQGILDALKTGDKKLVLRAMKLHMDNTYQHACAHVERDSDEEL